MEGLQQLEHEIQRHLALAQLTDGAIRDGHLEAARQLAALRDTVQRRNENGTFDNKVAERRWVLHEV